MVMDYIIKIARVIASVLDWMFMVVINIVVVPLSFLYTTLTKHANSAWRVEYNGIPVYFWWSGKLRVVMRAAIDKGKGCQGAQVDLQNPRSFLVSLVIVLLPMLAAWIVSSVWLFVSNTITDFFKRVSVARTDNSNSR